jgi:hypothetical protein
MAALVAACVACGVACTTGDGRNVEPCTVGFLGDQAGTLDFDLQVLDANDTVMTLADGADVPMIAPPQGGRVIFVGVHATNLDGCAVKLTGALRDPVSQSVTLDSRTINLIATGDGWGVSGTPATAVSSAVANFSNVPVCPDQWSSQDVYGVAYGLEVTVQDRGGRQLTKTITVTPQCAEPNNVNECLCICKKGYVLGQACNAPVPEAGPGVDAGGE